MERTLAILLALDPCVNDMLGKCGRRAISCHHAHLSTRAPGLLSSPNAYYV
jgi:hypothetical protein